MAMPVLTIAAVAHAHTASHGNSGALIGPIVLILVGIVIGRAWGRWAALKHLGEAEFRTRWKTINTISRWLWRWGAPPGPAWLDPRRRDERFLAGTWRCAGKVRAGDNAGRISGGVFLAGPAQGGCQLGQVSGRYPDRASARQYG